MTRINVVPVSELCDQHLLAEHRELTRIPNGLIAGRLKENYPDRPTKYTLGPGHVKFFTNKILWLLRRYEELTKECKVRGFNVTDIWPVVPLGDWVQVNWWPDKDDLALNRQRIKERWPKNARYYGKKVDRGSS